MSEAELKIWNSVIPFEGSNKALTELLLLSTNPISHAVFPVTITGLERPVEPYPQNDSGPPNAMPGRESK